MSYSNAKVAELSSANLARIASMVRSDSGIAIPEEKGPLVYSRLSKRVRALGMKGFDEYCSFVEDRSGADERQHMLSALTTNVTRFYREPHHFNDLASEVLPPLFERARRGDRIRLWSAGCSTGQEAYTIALTLLSVAPDADRLDIRILASDIDPNVVDVARQGRYSRTEISTVPEDLLDKYFSDCDNSYLASEKLKSLISFKNLNLIGNWPIKNHFDVIFCRNVVIYFEPETQDRLLVRFADVMKPGGRLFIGHSERVARRAASLFEQCGVTSYRRV